MKINGVEVAGEQIVDKIDNLRQVLGLPPNACISCGHPVIGWQGEPRIPSHTGTGIECPQGVPLFATNKAS